MSAVSSQRVGSQARQVRDQGAARDEAEPFLRVFRRGWWLPRWTIVPMALDALDRLALAYLERRYVIGPVRRERRS